MILILKNQVFIEDAAVSIQWQVLNCAMVSKLHNQSQNATFVD